MKFSKFTRSFAGSLFVLLGMHTGMAVAQSPIRISLTSAQTSYLETDPLELFIRVSNTSGSDAYVTRGFMQRDFHLLLDLNGPQGNIRSLEFAGDAEPLGAFNTLDELGFLRPAVPCDKVPPTDLTDADPANDGTEKLFDLRNYYPITSVGGYDATVEVELEVFHDYVELANGAIYCFVDNAAATGTEQFNPLTSNTVAFSINPLVVLPESQIRVTSELLAISPGSRPDVNQTPINKMRVQLFEMNSIPADYLPVGHKTYALISESDLVDPVQVRFTDSQGNATFAPVLQGDYLLIATYKTSTDTRYVGARVTANNKDWGIQGIFLQEYLKVFLLPNMDTAPGRTRRLTGSELLITQPEYIEWDSAQEYYPFVFESVGDWNVTTTVQPPEGFVADADALEATINNDLEAVQFSVVDVGTKWVDFDVTYDVEHKKKKTKIKDKIGMRLEKKLAKKKNLGLYGESESPGDFVGGKKIKNKK
ncbi:MAG: hypothetical protein OEY45_11285 [Gammaproteobacteria bacterium]|nr:hypothetical protein [Gammaproteobacteria bacterium]